MSRMWQDYNVYVDGLRVGCVRALSKSDAAWRLENRCSVFKARLGLGTDREVEFLTDDEMVEREKEKTP